MFLLEAILILLVWESLQCLAFTSGTNLIVYLWTDFCLYSLLSHYVPRFVKSSLSTLSNIALQHVVRQNTTDGLLINRPSHMECYKHDSTTHLQKYTQTDIQCNHTLETRLHILTHKTWVTFFLRTRFFISLCMLTWTKWLFEIYNTLHNNSMTIVAILYYFIKDNAVIFYNLYSNHITDSY